MEFIVHENSPEPFASTATIRYELENEAIVQISVYDPLGTLILTQIEGCRAPGSHVLLIDASNWPDGCYYYLLQAGEASTIKKMNVSR